MSVEGKERCHTGDVGGLHYRHRVGGRAVDIGGQLIGCLKA